MCLSNTFCYQVTFIFSPTNPQLHRNTYSYLEQQQQKTTWNTNYNNTKIFYLVLVDRYDIADIFSIVRVFFLKSFSLSYFETAIYYFT